MWPRIVYMAPSGNPLVQGACEVLVFLTWKVTGSWTMPAPSAGAAPVAPSAANVSAAASGTPRRRRRLRAPDVRPARLGAGCAFVDPDPFGLLATLIPALLSCVGHPSRRDRRLAVFGGCIALLYRCYIISI